MTDKHGRVAGKCPRVLSTLLAFLCCLAPASLLAQSATGRSQAVAVAEYVVQAGDVLSVLIWGGPTQADKLDGRFPVESSGLAYLPVVGAVQVAGKTTAVVQTELRRRLAGEQSQAVISIEPLFAVSVNGEVGVPNVYDFRPGQTIFDAISRAGGYTQDADRLKILLVRDGQPQTIEASNTNDLAAKLAQEPLRSGDRLLIHPRKRLALTSIVNLLQAAISVATLYALVAN